jgi:hypothetical protein
MSDPAGIRAADHRNMEKELGCRRRGIFVESWHPCPLADDKLPTEEHAEQSGRARSTVPSTC